MPGVSKNVCSRDSSAQVFPDWIELLTRAATLVKSDGTQGTDRLVQALLEQDPPELLEAARRAQAAVARPIWSSFLYEQFAVDQTTVADDSLTLPRLIWHLGSNLVITTNYDNVLQWSSPDRNVLTLHIENGFFLDRFLKNKLDRSIVWHLHGEIDHPHELILSPDGYEKLYHSENQDHTGQRYQAALATLRTVLMTKHLLFIGFSFADQEFQKQLNWLTEVFGGQSGPYYALVHQNRLREIAAPLKKVGVECVPYSEHGEPLVALLGELAAIAGCNPSVSLVKNSRKLEILPVKGVNYVRSGNDNYKANAQFRFDIEVRLISNIQPFVISGFSAHYIAPDGCYCLNQGQHFKINRNIMSYGGDEHTLIDPVTTSTGFMHVAYGRVTRPPMMEQIPADCDYGDVLVRASFLDQNKEEMVESYFRFEPGGDLVSIEREREPPHLSDSSLVDLRARGLITDEEYVEVTSINARDRYRAVTFDTFNDALHLPKRSHMKVTPKFRALLRRIRHIELNGVPPTDDEE